MSSEVQERRAFGRDRPSPQRTREMLLVSYTIGDEYSPEFTELYDISPGGMAMLTNAALDLGTTIAVQLELRGDSEPVLRLRGDVRWSRFDSMLKHHRTGVAFLDVDDELRKHLQRYVDTLHLLHDMGTL